MTKASKIVYKITDDIDPKEVYCTTYQMRDVWGELATAHMSSLNITSLHMHHKAAELAKSGDKILDVCCGRAMALPLLRRIRPKILSYTGVDIKPANFGEAYRRSASMKIASLKLAPQKLVL